MKTKEKQKKTHLNMEIEDAIHGTLNQMEVCLIILSEYRV